MERIFQQLKERFIEAVHRNRAEGILFSGGLDSALVAACSRHSTAVSIELESWGEDAWYAERVARFLNLDHHHETVKIEEAVSVIPEVIKILKSFDPAIPNDVTVYLGFNRAKTMGIGEMMTGDGSDEIFAGYEFMVERNDLQEYLDRISTTMRFGSNAIGEAMEIDIKQPFLDTKFMIFSRAIDLDLKIKKDDEKIWGKWILRKAFEGMLPQEILWQGERPLEYGSGMTKLRDVIESKVSDREFEEGKARFPIRFWSKEHFYYYRIYRDMVGEIPAPRKGDTICPCCGAGMKQGAFHCRVCGECC